MLLAQLAAPLTCTLVGIKSLDYIHCMALNYYTTVWIDVTYNMQVIFVFDSGVW